MNKILHLDIFLVFLLQYSVPNKGKLSPCQVEGQLLV